MPIKAERLEADVVANTKGAERDLDRFQRKVGQTGKSMEDAGKKATGFGEGFKVAGTLVKGAAIGMAGSIVGKAVMAGSDLNEQLSKTGVVFGPQAKMVTDEAKRMADQFGINKTTFLEAAGNIGLVAKASGLTQKASASLSNQFADLAADASSFYNVPVEQALEAMRSGLVGESEPMRQFGVLLSEAAVQTEALRLGLVKPVKDTDALRVAQTKASLAQSAYTKALKEHGKGSDEAKRAMLNLKSAQQAVGKAAAGNVPQLTEQQKVQARASLITKGMADAQGDLARTQNSVANRTRELQGRIQNLSADLGTKALPAVAAFLTVLVEGPQKIAAWVKGIKGWSDEHPVATKAIGLTAAAITALFIPAMVKGAAVATATKVKVVAGWVAQQAAAVKANAMVAVNMARTIAFYVHYGAIVAAQATKTAALWVAQQARMVASSVASGARLAATWVATNASILASQIATNARLAALWVAQTAQAAASMAATVARVVAGWVVMGVQSMIQAARMAAAWVIAMGPIGWAIAAIVAAVALVIANWGKVKAATAATWGWIKGAVSAAVGGVKAAVSAAFGFITKVFLNFTGPGLIIKHFATIKSAVTGALGAVKGAVSSGWHAVQSMTSSAWEAVSGAVSKGVGKVVGFVKGIPGKIRSAMGNVGGILTGAGNAIIDSLLGPLRAGADKVRGILQGITDKIPDWKGPKNRDKTLLTKNGQYIMEGLVKGLKMGHKGVKSYLGTVTNGFAKAMGTGNAAAVNRYVNDVVMAAKRALQGKAEKSLVASVKRLGAKANATLKAQAATSAALAAQIAKRDALVQAKSDFQGAMESGISSQANVLNAGNTASAIRASLETQVAKARAFVTNLKRLKAMGYAAAVIQQVAAAGIEQGAAVAAALAQGNPADVKGISSAFTTITSMAKSESASMAAGFYDAGINAANGMIKGLQAKQKSIEATLLAIAKGMQKAIKKALGIHSPSRVMANLFKFVGAGAVKGLEAMHRPMAKAGTRFATVASSSIAGGLGDAGLPPGAPGGGSGPLTPAATGGASGGRTVNFNFTVHNPKDEPTSRTTNKALDRVTALGLS